MKQNKKIDELVSELGKEEILNYLSNIQKPFEYTDIKSYEDALKFSELDDINTIHDCDTKDIVALKKIRHIFKAINNGWEPDYSNPNEYKYYPWFRVLPSGLDYSLSFAFSLVRLARRCSPLYRYVCKG